MKPIAILETGQPPEALRDAFDDYPARFRALLGTAEVRRALARYHGAIVVLSIIAGVLAWRR